MAPRTTGGRASSAVEPAAQPVEVGAAIELLEAALRRGEPGPYQVQAAIAACHCTAAEAADTDWSEIAHLYERLSHMRVFDGERVLRLDGDLTIRDETRSVSLDVEYLGWSDDPWGGKRAGFSVRTEIDRDDFGANWNVVLETGSLLVGKRVLVEVEIEAVLSVDQNGGR